MDFISDLQRSFIPLPEQFVQEIESEDRFLLAFPRSGSRWLMRMLSDLAEVAYNLEPSQFYERYLEKLSRKLADDSTEPPFFPATPVVPDAHLYARDKSALLAAGITPIFRAHNLAEIITRANGAIVYPVRHPAPALYSYYRFARTGGHVPASISLEEFFSGQLPLWKDHVSTMLQLHRATPGRVLFLTYRDPGPFVRAQLEAAATHFGIPVTPETVDWALARLERFFVEINAHPATQHSRGVNHALIHELPVELQHWVHAEAGDLYEQVMAAEEKRL